MIAPALMVLLMLSQLFAGLEPITPRTPIEISGLPPKSLEMTIYVERLGECPAEERRITSLLPKALEAHREAVIRFLGELGSEYDDLLRIRLAITDSEAGAKIIFRVRDLPPPIAGRAITGGEWPQEVEIDCDMGRPGVTDAAIISSILHELYHVLGISHTVGDEFSLDELMSGVRDPGNPIITYPSTLDLYALWYRFFKLPDGHPRMAISLPKEIPYVQSRPYGESLEKLAEAKRKLESENRELKIMLRDDIVRLEDRVKGLESRAGSAEQAIGNLTESVKSLDERVESLKSELSNLGSDLSKLEERVSAGEERSSKALSEIMKSLWDIGDRLDDVEKEARSLAALMEIYEAEIQSLRAAVRSMVIGIFIGSMILMAVAIAMAIRRAVRKG